MNTEKISEEELHLKRWKLVYLNEEGKEFQIRKKQILVGRSESCDLVIKDKYMSTIHASITLGKNKVILLDLDSSNGTFLNEKEIDQENITEGDIISFGDNKFRFAERKSEETTTFKLPELDDDKTVVFNLNDLKSGLGTSLPPSGHASNVFKANLPPLPPIDASKGKVLPTPKRGETPREDSVGPDQSLTPLDFGMSVAYSEFIFEDEETLYPIFDYTIQRPCVEVLMLLDDTVYFIDYLSMAKKKYFLVTKGPTDRKIFCPILQTKKKVPFISISEGSIFLHPIPDLENFYSSTSMGSKKNFSESIELSEDDFVRFQKDDFQILVRCVDSPPKVTPPPFLRKDSYLLKYTLPLILCGALFLTFLQFIKVTDKKHIKNAPVKISRILYQSPKKIKPKPKLKKVKEIKKAKHDPQVQKIEVAQIQRKKRNIIKMKKTPSQRVKKRKVFSPKKPVEKKPAFKTFRFGKQLTNLISSSKKIKNVKIEQNNNLKLNNAIQANPTSKKMKIETGGKDPKNSFGDELSPKNNSYSATGLGENKKSFKSVLKKTLILGSIDPESIRELLQSNIPRLRNCYEQELERLSDTSGGKMTLHFTIGKKGTVTKGKIVMKAGKISSQGKKCIVSILKGIKFPVPKGGGIVQVKQPVNFETRH